MGFSPGKRNFRTTTTMSQGPESKGKGKSLRDAILEDMQLPANTKRTPRSEDQQVFDFGIQTLQFSKNPTKDLSDLFGARVGMDGATIAKELKKLTVESWDKMDDQQRKKFPGFRDKVNDLRQELSDEL